MAVTGIAECASFNGATAFQPWRFPASLDDLVKKYLLQWGHSFSAVEICCKCDRRGQLQLLQWGHSFSAVEMRQ